MNKEQNHSMIEKSFQKVKIIKKQLTNLKILKIMILIVINLIKVILINKSKLKIKKLINQFQQMIQWKKIQKQKKYIMKMKSII